VGVDIGAAKEKRDFRFVIEEWIVRVADGVAGGSYELVSKDDCVSPGLESCEVE